MNLTLSTTLCPPSKSPRKVASPRMSLAPKGSPRLFKNLPPPLPCRKNSPNVIKKNKLHSTVLEEENNINTTANCFRYIIH